MALLAGRPWTRVCLFFIIIFSTGFLSFDWWGSYWYVLVLNRGYPSTCELPMPQAPRPDPDIQTRQCPALTAPPVTSLSNISHAELANKGYDQRLDYLLERAPAFLSLADVAAIEARLAYRISRPHKITVTFSWGGMLPATFSTKKCPSCTYSLNMRDEPPIGSNRPFGHVPDAEAILYYNCLIDVLPIIPLPRQPLFCRCGEAEQRYDAYWRRYCDVNMDMGGEMHTTWYRHSYVRTVRTVSDFVKHLLQPPPIRDPRRVGIFVQANCGTRSGREHWIWGMQRTGAIDSLGRCLNNSGPCSIPAPPFGHGEEAVVLRDQIKVDQVYDYHFGSALENTVYDHYITEKRWHVWAAKSVPFVYGNRNANWSRMSTPGENSAIFLDDFSSPKELGEFMVRVANNRTEYLKFFEWQCKGIRKEFVRELFVGMDEHACRVCERVEEIQNASLNNGTEEFVTRSLPLRSMSRQLTYGIHEYPAWVFELGLAASFLVLFALFVCYDRRLFNFSRRLLNN